MERLRKCACSGDDYLVFIIWDGSVLGLRERAFSEIMGSGELTSLPGVFPLFKGPDQTSLFSLYLIQILNTSILISHFS